MKHILCFVVFIFIISFSQKSYSQSDRWLYLGQTADSISVYIDKQSMHYFSSSNYFEVYTKTVSPDNSYQMHLEIYYCKKRTFKTKDTTFFDKEGSFTGSEQSNHINNVLPDSYAEIVFKYLCK